ncbi:MAG: hypothetical protein ACPG77_05575 [Nannocystaceae bacterium]
MSSSNLFAMIAFASLWVCLGGFFWLVFRFLRQRANTRPTNDLSEHGL